MNQILTLYRKLPWFRGKLRLGKKIFGNCLDRPDPVSFFAHGGIQYLIPNTMENLGVELLINGVYEQDVVGFLKKNIPANAVYFDIGANIGSLALPILKSRPQIRYRGFEASPFVFNFLEQNFKANGFKTAGLINKLVHNKDGMEVRFFQSDWYGKNSMAPVYSSEFITVDSITIDDYCRQEAIHEIDWMKIDVQGFELYAFEGMKVLLGQKKIKNLLFEFESWAEESAGLKGGTAINYIEAMGYQLYTMSGRPWSLREAGKATMIWARPLPD